MIFGKYKIELVYDFADWSSDIREWNFGPELVRGEDDDADFWWYLNLGPFLFCFGKLKSVKDGR